MSRFQVLVGTHVQDEERVSVVNGKEVKRIVQAHYTAHHPIHGSKFNVVDASRAVVAARDAAGKVVGIERRDEIDLCKKFNQPGVSEKFRKLQEPEQLAQDMNNEDLMRFAKVAIAKGLVSEADLEAIKNTGNGLKVPEVNAQQTVAQSAQAATISQDPLMVSSIKRDLLAIANQKTPLVGLQTMAENEEIDISGCKNDKGEWREAEVRKVLKAALEARLK